MLYQRYQISSCYSEWQDLNNLPEAVYKEWTISKTQETLTVLCNGVEVINLVYAEVTVEPCSATWSKNVTKIQFTDSDTASDLRKYQTLGMQNLRVEDYFLEKKHFFIPQLRLRLTYDYNVSYDTFYDTYNCNLKLTDE